MSEPKIAIVHDWIPVYGGAERVLNQISIAFPKADIYTLILNKKAIKDTHLEKMSIITSWPDKIPFKNKLYRNLIFLYPQTIENLDLTDYDIIISSSHSVTKGVITNSKQLHVCYTNNIMLYAWNQYPLYRKALGWKKHFFSYLFHKIRIWDFIASQRPNFTIANSAHTADMLEQYFKIKPDIIHPSADTNKFKLGKNKEDFYVVVARLVPFKRVELVVQAFNKIKNIKLVIIGDGPERPHLEKMAVSPNIEFKGEKNSDDVYQYVVKARGLISASEEPFGISLVEAQACGTPVISYKEGGGSEIIENEKTGYLFQHQTPESILEAINWIEANHKQIDPEYTRNRALKFSDENFVKRIEEYIYSKWAIFNKK